MKAVICGAGIAGLALAQRLLTHSWQVCVVERAPGPREQGYMIDFFGAGYEAADAIGILPRLKELAYPVDEAAFVDSAGRRRARISYARLVRALGGRLLDIMRPDLELALREQVAGKAELRFGCGPVEVQNSHGGVSVTLTDGSRLEADLLVGADGIHSAVRRLVFGPEENFFRYLGFQTAAFVFDDAEMSARFNGRFTATDSTNRMMGLYGLRNGRVAVFAVHRCPNPALPADYQAAVRQAYSTLGWLVPRVLAKCPPSSEMYYDQVAQVVVPDWSRDRVTLLGDACQAVSLVAGQGASLAIAGAYLLGELLATEESIGRALERYQELWMPFVSEKQRVGRRDAQWFLPSSPLQLWMRRIIIGASSAPGFDTFFGAALVGKPSVALRQLSSNRTAPAPLTSALANHQDRIAPDQRGRERSSSTGERAIITSPPGLLLRIVFRAPVWLYHLKLGWLLRHRLMLLTHRGRRSGHLYRTVLEVAEYNPRTHESIVGSGWGTRADWYRNVTAGGAVEVETGGERYRPEFRVLAPEENYDIIADYMRRLPPIMRPLVYRLGLDVRGSEAQRRAHSEQLLMVAFRPLSVRLPINDQPAPNAGAGVLGVRNV